MDAGRRMAVADIPSQERGPGSRASPSGLSSPIAQEDSSFPSSQDALSCVDSSTPSLSLSSGSTLPSSPLRKGIVTLVGSDERALFLQAAKNRVRSFHYFYCGGPPPDSWQSDFRNRAVRTAEYHTPPASSTARPSGPLTEGRRTKDETEGEAEARSASDWEAEEMRGKMYVPDESTTEWGSK